MRPEFGRTQYLRQYISMYAGVQMELYLWGKGDVLLRCGGFDLCPTALIWDAIVIGSFMDMP